MVKSCSLDFDGIGHVCFLCICLYLNNAQDCPYIPDAPLMELNEVYKLYLTLDETARINENLLRDMARRSETLTSQLNEADQALLINEQRTTKEEFYK